mmetsp:Transcript_493/g.795  ORF Transcript_493/g.795 Transcript_493/m.795 type:complete len:294 (-) Transcript_493:87-968(-)|eukprot:CAMPEP_0113620624 /NCGR_PEP_ID=MMETSP0017_2-20120614/10514_1 /TAXON_ID=2856 /ORGANISM="Cylindrotheca closterium" /LENGTH=293 /DNA_ID=CAMNT_0000530301 /DNA_START=30 /DNA_END=911 /DNA_ORIENTATION=- /assembly_acc=CAM_ASM_000147
MVVPNIRNPNRYRTLEVARPTKSKYHLEPDHAVSYTHVGRRTKGGTGGGYVYGSSRGAYNSNDGSGTNTLASYLIAGFIVLGGVCLVVFLCFKSEKSRNENHGDIRTTRNSVYRQRSERANNAASNDNTTANAIQFHTSPNAYNSPSGGDPIPYVTALPERNVAMKSYFHFQTVLPDKSNLDPQVLREEAALGDTASDEDSVIENGDPPGKKSGRPAPPNYQLSSRLFMSTWRRPTANDECSICLLSYKPGQTICLAKNTRCKHVFHHDCIEEWLKDHSDCPLCRTNLMYKPP